MPERDTGAQAYPLAWPQGWPRTAHPKPSRFDVTFEKARQELTWDIQRMGGRYVVISTNLPLRRDGFPYSDKHTVVDTGVAVYFERNGKQMVFACDRWNAVRDNMRAIYKTIDAMRGIERWGASEMMERAFSAFEALPPPKSWRQVLGLNGGPVTREAVDAAYRRAAMKAHPDLGGKHDDMAAINAARDAALKEIGA